MAFKQPQFDELPLFSAPEPVLHNSQVSPLSVIEKTEKPDPSERCELMLARLQQGPLSCREAETFVHRGQAVIDSLRKLGWVIDTLEKTYFLRGHDGTVEVTPELKQQYYSTQHWHDKALERKRHDDWKCVQCKGNQDLHTHHWKYDLFNEDVESDLLTLCEICHDILHNVCKGSSLGWPHRVSPEIADRIKAEATR